MSQVCNISNKHIITNKSAISVKCIVKDTLHPTSPFRKNISLSISLIIACLLLFTVDKVFNISEKYQQPNK